MRTRVATRRHGTRSAEGLAGYLRLREILTLTPVGRRPSGTLKNKRKCYLTPCGLRPNRSELRSKALESQDDHGPGQRKALRK